MEVYCAMYGLMYEVDGTNYWHTKINESYMSPKRNKCWDISLVDTLFLIQDILISNLSFILNNFSKFKSSNSSNVEIW